METKKYNCKDYYCVGDRVELCIEGEERDDISEGTIYGVGEDFVVVRFDKPLIEHKNSTVYDCYELYTVDLIHLIVQI